MKKYQFECWNVAFRRHLDAVEENTDAFVIIKNPLFFWAADPFIVFYQDEYYIFAELYNRLTYKGDIRYCRLSPDGKVLSTWKKVLHTGSHLSFPFVFRQGGSYYMMPESSKANELVLYRAVDFPEKWIRDIVIADHKKYADSVILDTEHMLTYDNYSRPRRLLLLEKQGEEWKELSIIEDPEVIYRPGGKAFVYRDIRMIPMQDSHNGEYGGSLAFRTVDLRKMEFGKVFSITPDCLRLSDTLKSNVIGIHTYNADHEYEVVDIKTRQFDIFSFIGYYARKVSRFFS